MCKALAVALISLLSACASQPQVAQPSPGPDHSVIAAPEPEASVEATDIVMLAERVASAVALIVSSVLADGYSDTPH